MRNNNYAAVVCEQVTKTFKQGSGHVMGLDRVDLTVDAGDSICLSGPSGSGKTTLLNAIGGLATPDSGTIRIDDHVLSSMSDSERAQLRLKNIGFVFQSYNLVPVLSALENVAFIMEMQGRNKQEIDTKARAILDRVGLAGLYDRRPSQLSGGQQQRVAVARAIVSNPTLVLADEPTANLDSQTAIQLMALFQTLNQESGTTFIIASHDNRVNQFTKRQIVMQDGHIESDTRA
ncbi:MAG: ABC transporter ATP-binding protein [Halieaceae bacterium]|nr:ABC transporter ATP-binding protein [Halieaceae bacterium]